MDNVNAIVGENNSGKTAVIRVLNAFFNITEKNSFIDEKKAFLNDAHLFKPRANTYITITFKNIPQNKIFNQYKIINAKV